MTRLDTPRAVQADKSELKSTQLKKHLVADLAAGRLRPGIALPSEVRLADEFKVSRPTVRRALSEMEQEGLIRRERGRGTFVNEDVQQRLQTTTGTFALLISGSQDLEALPLIRGFEQACRSARHNMLLCDSENDLHLQGDLILGLLQSNIAGVAILPVSSPSTPLYHITNLQDRGIPVVCCHRGAEGGNVPVLSVPHEEQGRLVGRALAEQGHQRVAMLVGYRAESIIEKWTRGIRESLKTVGGELPEEFIYSAEWTSIDPTGLEAELSEQLEKMLGSENPPTAIFAVTDDFAHSMHFLLERMGLRVPEDISLIGLGDIDRKGPFIRRLTSMVIDGAEMGRQAVQLLGEIQEGQRNISNSENISVPVLLSGGQTLGAAPKSPVRIGREDGTQTGGSATQERA